MCGVLRLRVLRLRVLRLRVLRLRLRLRLPRKVLPARHNNCGRYLARAHDIANDVST